MKKFEFKHKESGVTIYTTTTKSAEERFKSCRGKRTPNGHGLSTFNLIASRTKFEDWIVTEVPIK